MALPPRQRQDTLHNSLDQHVLPVFAGPILSFDDAAFKAFAVLSAHAQLDGKAGVSADGYFTAITAIAAAHGLIVPPETPGRFTGPFEAVGPTVTNP